MRAHLDTAANAAIDAFLAQAIPLGGKMGDPPNDITPILVFFASDAAHFITGQTIAVDGGFMMVGDARAKRTVKCLAASAKPGVKWTVTETPPKPNCIG